jgi:hypothetical protein
MGFVSTQAHTVTVTRAHSYRQTYGHDLTRELQLIGFNTDRAAA